MYNGYVEKLKECISRRDVIKTITKRVGLKIVNNDLVSNENLTTMATEPEKAYIEPAVMENEVKINLLNLNDYSMYTKKKINNALSVLKHKNIIDEKIFKKHNIDKIHAFESNMMEATVKVELDIKRQEETLEDRLRDRYINQKVNF